MDAFARPLRALINLHAIKHNYQLARQLAPHSEVWAVVKANAYGHGAVAVAKALGEKADGFAVACLSEAQELRAAGIAKPIVLLEGVFAPSELAWVDRLALEMAVHSPEQIAWLKESNPQQPFRCWLKLDSGMHRVGFEEDDFPQALRELEACPQVGKVRALSHFARADETDTDYTQQQLACAERVLHDLPIERSQANSAGILAWPASHQQIVREGIMLYGISPGPTAAAYADRLQPAMSLCSALIAVRTVKAGSPIGYGGRFICEHDMRIGVVAAGYADGYPRHAVDGTPVMVGGYRTRLVGRVSMDMLTVDVTDIPDAKLGTEVELWGSHLGIDEVATCCGTISYELLTGLSRRVPLCYA